MELIEVIKSLYYTTISLFFLRLLTLSCPNFYSEKKTEKGIFLLEEVGEENKVPEKRTMFLGDVAITSKEVFDHQSYETRKRIENIKRVLLYELIHSLVIFFF